MNSNYRFSRLLRVGSLLTTALVFTLACGEKDDSSPSHFSPTGGKGPGGAGGATGEIRGGSDAKGGESTTTSVTFGGTAGASGSVTGTSEPISPESSKDADELFSMTEIPRFEVTIADADWAEMQKDPTTEQTYPARVKFNGSDQGTMGIRYKGNYGTLNLCVGEGGELKCPKLSMKLEFAESVKDKRFYGLKKLNLHALARDPTRLHDKISYSLFREMDIVAPRSHFANLTINGKDYGLFATVEQMDGRFTKDRFDGIYASETGNGNLYKEAWPIAADAAFFQSRLETNKTTGDALAYSEFGNALVHGEGTPRERLGKYMDLDYLARYMAVDDAIFNWDGVTTMYCDSANPKNCSSHNYYVYQEEQSKKFWLVPWDLDGTLRVLATFNVVPHWTKKPADCTQRYAALGGSVVAAPGCDPFFEGIAGDLTAYKAAVGKLLDGPFSEQSLRERIDKWANFIAQAVRADPISGNEKSWRGSVDALKAEIPFLRERLAALRDGTVPVPLQLSTTKICDLEEASRLGYLFGVEVNYNGASTVSTSLNQQDPLSGAQDAKLSFVYRDEPGAPAWTQWLNWKFALEKPTDVSALTGIRVKMRADSSRRVRVDLFSPKGKQDVDGIHFGWDVPVTTQAKTFELTFESSELPAWATSRTDVKATVLSSVSSLIFFPEVKGRGTSGFLRNQEDIGELYVDDIEFY